jgi:biotin transporter BioY
LGFTLSAFVSGKIAHSGVITYRRISVALAVGLAIAYGVGLAYAACILTLYLNQNLLLWEFLLGYLLLTLPKDVILTALTVPLAKRLLPHVL